MSPHSEDLHSSLFLQDLIHEPVLDVDSSRVRSCEITHEFFEWGRILEGIFCQDQEQNFCLTPQARSG